MRPCYIIGIERLAARIAQSRHGNMQIFRLLRLFRRFLILLLGPNRRRVMSIAVVEAPSAEVAEKAKSALRVLETVHPQTNAAMTVGADGGDSLSVVVPRDAFKHFLEILGHLANGNAVTIVPIHAELTTQEAADLLNVSRPYVIGLIRAGKLECRKVGKHRRIRFADLMKYKQEDDLGRREAVDELTAEAQRLGLGY